VQRRTPTLAPPTHRRRRSRRLWCRCGRGF
jgi:hypothetical protein